MADDDGRDRQAFIMPVLTASPEFVKLSVRPDKTINFHAVIPLYESEMNFKLKKGADALADCLIDAAVTDTIDPKRPVAGKKKKRFFLF